MSTGKFNRQSALGSQRGLSLVEILVGVLIGMIGIVVIFQVLAVAEERKRNTSMGSDAQSSGSIGLYLLERDAKLAGYGFGTAHAKQLGCSVSVHDNGDNLVVPPVAPSDFTFPLVPILITQGALGAPDTVTFLKGSTRYSVQHREFEFVTPGDPTSPLTVKNGRIGLEWGNVILMATWPNQVPSNTTGYTDCALIQVTHRPTASALQIDHQLAYESASAMVPYLQLPGGASSVIRFNKAGYPQPAEFQQPVGVIKAHLFDLGPQPRRTTWSVQANKLVVSEGLMVNAPPQEAADGIINLQAEYGIDQNGDGIIGATEWTTTAPDNTKAIGVAVPACDATLASWRCVRAVRVALLARSAFFDKTACSPNPQYLSGAAGVLARANFVMTNIDGSADAFSAACNESPPSPNNWRRYRYRVYETAIPLRNMIWANVPGVEVAGVED